MLTEAELSALAQAREFAEMHNQILRELVVFTTKIVGDEDIAHNFIYELWDLERVKKESEK